MKNKSVLLSILISILQVENVLAAENNTTQSILSKQTQIEKEVRELENITETVLTEGDLGPGAFPILEKEKGFIADSNFKLRLRNEFRNTQRDSARQIWADAWVQGMMLDYSSGYYNDIIGVDISHHRVERISANPEKDTRYYLNGHSSFDRGIVPSVKLKYGDSKLQLGRFINDFRYGGWEYEVPFMNSSSLRTLPNVMEGAIFQTKITDEYSIYAKYLKSKLDGFNTGSWSGGKTGVKNMKYELLDEKPELALSGVYDKKTITLTAGVQIQDDVANQYKVTLAKKIFLKNKKVLKLDLMGYYAEVLGPTKDYIKTLSSSMDGQDTAVYSGMVSYFTGNTMLFTSMGYVNKKVAPITGINTDITFVIEQSLDRTHADMYSYQIGGFQKITNNFNAGIAIPVTYGYAENNKETKINGIGVNLMADYTFKSGSLDGLKIGAVLNKALEDRIKDGDSKGYKYYDIKLTMQYDFDFKPNFF